MSEFEPTSDLGRTAEEDDQPVDSTAKSRDLTIQRRRNRILIVVVLALAAGALAFGFPTGRVVGAALMMYVVFRVGLAIIGAFARPVPAPPPAGELRKVKLTYRCGMCNSEMRMTLSNDDNPSPPRHCTDEMDLIATADDAL